jgi:hypothetical protein
MSTLERYLSVWPVVASDGLILAAGLDPGG